MRLLAWLWVVLVARLAAAGWGGRSEKAGGAPARGPTVLTLEVWGAPWLVDRFADEVDRRSHGSLRVDVRAGRRTNEVGVIGDVGARRADLGAVGSRAFESVGV